MKLTLGSLGPAKRPRAALYLRVSTEEQTVENQRPDLLRIARARAARVVETYEEKASAVGERPAFDRMMADAHAGRFDMLIIWAIDRFGRTIGGNLDAVLALDKRHVTIVSAREPWLEVDGPSRELLIAVFSWVAQQERVTLIERTRAGMSRAKKQGKQIGRPRALTSPLLVGGMMAKPGATFASVAKLLQVSHMSVRRTMKVLEARARAGDVNALELLPHLGSPALPPPTFTKGGGRKRSAK